MSPQGENDSHDKEWADMKTGWQSTSIAETFMTEKLRWSLRLRMVGSWLWLGLEVVSMIMVAVIAVFEFMRGNVGCRGCADRAQHRRGRRIDLGAPLTACAAPTAASWSSSI